MKTSNQTHSQPHASQETELENWGLSYASGYFHLGMHNKATEELDALSKAIQKQPEVLSLRGRILLAEKRWQETIDFCETSRKKFPWFADFYIQAALAYDKQGKHSDARTTWLAAPHEIRTTAFYHYNLARCEVKLGHFALARQHVKATLSLSPGMKKVLCRDQRLIPFVQDPSLN